MIALYITAPLPNCEHVPMSMFAFQKRRRREKIKKRSTERGAQMLELITFYASLFETS